MPVGQTVEAELKIAKLKLALSGQCLIHIRASLHAVAAIVVVDFEKHYANKAPEQGSEHL